MLQYGISRPVNGVHQPAFGRGTLALVGATMAAALILIVGVTGNGKLKRRRS